MTRQCTSTTSGSGCEVKDCEVGEWEDWGSCYPACGVGTKIRNRSVTQMPQGGGKSCQPKHMSEASADGCSRKCGAEGTCEDNNWADWSQWAECSVSCSGGTTNRTRVVITPANSCGNTVAGPNNQVAFCNIKSCVESKDCEMSGWTDWSECQDGNIEVRSRTIQTNGAGDGQMCNGDTQQTQPCGEPANSSIAMDCAFSDWQEWSDCVVEIADQCATDGLQRTDRTFAQKAEFGGKGCEGGMEKIKQCKTNKTCDEPTDCVLGDWSEWSGCSDQGIRTREKNVQVQETNGGQCLHGEDVEMGPCAAGRTIVVCEWGEWGTWLECSKTCGAGGIRARKRELSMKTKNATMLAALYQDSPEVAELKRHAQELREHGGVNVEFVAAFSAGGFALLVLSFGWRSLQGRIHYSPLDGRSADTFQ